MEYRLQNKAAQEPTYNMELLSQYQTVYFELAKKIVNFFSGVKQL